MKKWMVVLISWILVSSSVGFLHSSVKGSPEEQYVQLREMKDSILNSPMGTVYFVPTGNIYDDSALYAFYSYKTNPQSIVAPTQSSDGDDYLGKDNRPLLDGHIITFGGRIANRLVTYFEDSGMALVGYEWNGTHHMFKRLDNGLLLYAIDGATLNPSEKDYFVFQIYKNGDYLVFSEWGICAEGTYAGGACFIDIVYPNIENYEDSVYIFSWTDINSDGTPQSEEMDLLVSTFPAPPSIENWAVIIGASRYINATLDLKYANNSAQSMYDVLLTDPEWDEDHVVLLLDEMASRVNIQIAVLWLMLNADSNDRLLVYYSGHGLFFYDMPPFDEVDYWDELILTYSSFILDDTLNGLLCLIDVDSMVVIIDSCYSAGMIEDLEEPGRVLLSSSDGSKISWEHPDLENGVFTYYLVEGLAGQADLNQNGKISAEELFEYTLPKVIVFTEDFEDGPQIPQMYDGYEGELEFFNCGG